MKKLTIILIILIIPLMVGCYLDVEDLEQSNNYYIYSGKNEILDQGPQKDAILNLYIINFNTFDPLNPKSKNDNGFYSLIYSMLFEVDDDFNIISPLVDEYEYDISKKSLTIVLKENLKWSDGSLIGSRDLIYTLNAIKSISNGYYSSNVENIDTLARIDEKTVKILLKNNEENFIYKMRIPIIPENSDFKTLKFSGPYIISEEDETKISLVSNTNWYKTSDPYNKNQNISNINVYKYENTVDVFTDFNMKKLDFIYIPSVLYGTYDNRIDIKTYNFISDEYEMIIFNTNNDFYKDEILKDLIKNVLNPKLILNKINKEGIDIVRAPINSNSEIKEKEYSSVDDDILLKVKKYKIKAKTINLLLNSENRERRLLALEIKKVLEDKELIVNIDTVDYATYIKKLESDDYDLALIGTKIDFDPVSDYLYKPFPRYFYDINKVKHFLDTGYRSDDLSKLGEELVKTPNDMIYINRIIDIIDKDIPYIGLYFKKDGIAFSNRVVGIEKSIRNDFYLGIEDWYLVK